MAQSENAVIEEIQPNVYRIEVPIPNNPLKALNSYVLKGDERNLIVDTGVNHPEAADAMFSSLRDLGVDLNRTDLYATHMHVDHLGMVKRLATESSRLFFNWQEAASVNSDQHWKAVYSWEELYRSYLENGFPRANLEETIRAYPGFEYASGRDTEVVVVREGDVIPVGPFRLRCIETPGHSPGHMCLYEETTQLLFAGDHILYDVTPNVALFSRIGNPLEDYLASLDKLVPLDVKLVLPAHKRVFSDHRTRIAGIKQHHQERLDEVIHILEKGEQGAYQIVTQVEWQIAGLPWQELPYVHKFASFGETLAHLRYLEVQGPVRRIVRRGRARYSFNGRHKA